MYRFNWLFIMLFHHFVLHWLNELSGVTVTYNNHFWLIQTNQFCKSMHKIINRIEEVQVVGPLFYHFFFKLLMRCGSCEPEREETWREPTPLPVSHHLIHSARLFIHYNPTMVTMVTPAPTPMVTPTWLPWSQVRLVFPRWNFSPLT